MGAEARRQRMVRVGGVAGVVLIASCMIPAAAGADPVPGDWVADARASAVDMGAVTTGGFIVDRFDPSAALALSHLETGTDLATSLASAPYPSEIGQQGPGLLYGVLQNTLPYNGIPVPALGVAPSWPMTVRSSANGSDPTSASAGGETSPVWLKTDSHDRTTAGHAAAGGSAPGAFSILRMGAESSADAGQPATAVVKAVSTVQNLVVGDALKIAEVRTELAIKQETGAKPEVTVHRQITGALVGGVAAEMGPDGFVMAGSKAPLPQPALDALKAAGIEVRAGEQKNVAGGVSVSGLVIRRPFDFSQMSGGQLPLSVPKTMVFEMAFGVASGSIADLTTDEAAVAPAAFPAPGTSASTASAEPTTARAAVRPSPAEAELCLASAAVRPSPMGAGRCRVRAAMRPAQEAQAVLTAVARPDGSSGVIRPTLRLAADSAPAGTGAQQKKELGRLGWLAEIAVIGFVLLLVIRRGRRVVGGA